MTRERWIMVAVGIALAIGAIGAIGVVVRLTGGADRFGVSDAPDRASTTVRVGSYDVRGVVNGEELRLASTGQGPLHALTDMIRELDADILALQQVESREILIQMRDWFLSDLGYDHVASLDVGHDQGWENSLLSRYPIVNARVWPDLELDGAHPPTLEGERCKYAGQPFRFRRSPLMVELRIDGSSGPYGLTMLVIDHKGGDRYAYWRRAEAIGVTQLVSRFAQTDDVLVVGSFHAEPGDHEVEVYFERGYVDLFAARGERARWVTETSGDRADLMLANAGALLHVVPDSGFVLGMAEPIEPLSHLPLAVELHIDD